MSWGDPGRLWTALRAARYHEPTAANRPLDAACRFPSAVRRHGVSGRAAQDATNEVSDIIAKFSAAGGKGNIDGCAVARSPQAGVCSSSGSEAASSAGSLTPLFNPSTLPPLLQNWRQPTWLRLGAHASAGRAVRCDVPPGQRGVLHGGGAAHRQCLPLHAGAADALARGCCLLGIFQGLLHGAGLQEWFCPADQLHLAPSTYPPTHPPMQLLDAAAKVLVGISRGVDVTPDKVVKRYTEVRAWCACV